MCGRRMSWPERAHFAGRVVAHGDYKIHVRCIGARKGVPALAVEPFDWNARVCQDLQSEWVRLLVQAWITAGGISFEPGTAKMIQGGFRKDASGGVVSTQKEDINGLFGHDFAYLLK